MRRLVLCATAFGVAAALCAAQSPTPPNLMEHEKSPYLRGHARDPVAWMPFGDAALERARTEGKPIFLSIGYAACHWCHVMQRESFGDAEVALVLNRAFVCIKVDREERPDIDRVYIEACQRLNREGCGWPLTAFLTPTLQPFFVGTYFPKEEQHGRPGFLALALALEKAWKEDKDGIVERAAKITEYLRDLQTRARADVLPEPSLVADAVAALLADEDLLRGGFGKAPKFPSPNGPLLVLRHAQRTGVPALAAPVERLLDALLRGGIRDHLAGGFHRYSTDAEWRVPHFEKMLYDQAMLARLFLEGWQFFGHERYRDAVHEIFAFCRRELRGEHGGFIAALDAEVDGVEGANYGFTLAEIRAAMPDHTAAVVIAFTAATEEGHFEGGRNVVHEALSAERVAELVGQDVETVRTRWASGKAALRAARAKKPAPKRDTKVLLGWNALYLSALARAGAAFDDPLLVREAISTMDFLEQKLVDGNGRFLRSWAGGEARHEGELADAAALLNAALDLHEATLEARWLDRAAVIAGRMTATFAREDGRLVDSVRQDVLFETQDHFDGPWPSGTALAVVGLARLGHLRGDEPFLEAARAALRGVGRGLAQWPAGSPWVLAGLDLVAARSPRVELHGDLATREGRALLSTLRRGYRPFLSLTRNHDDRTGPPRALVCLGQHCLLPATTPGELEQRLGEALAADPADHEGEGGGHSRR